MPFSFNIFTIVSKYTIESTTYVDKYTREEFSNQSGFLYLIYQFKFNHLLNNFKYLVGYCDNATLIYLLYTKYTRISNIPCPKYLRKH